MARRGRPPHPDILTPREWEVLSLLREGLSNPEIADRLAISRETVKTHVSDILGKLGLTTREEASAWRREEHRPWWAAALGLLGKKGSAVALGVLVVAVGTGAAVLVWGLTRTSDANGPYTGMVASPNELVWQREYRQSTFRSVTPGTCGDAGTAQRYGVPQTLRVEESSMARGPFFLGLEAEPYVYHAQDVYVAKDMIVAPQGWQLSTRASDASPMVSVNRFSTGEIYLRRLDQPDALFRYNDSYCSEDGSPAATPGPGLPGGGVPYTLPNDAPQIAKHANGDYVSLGKALDKTDAADVSEDDVLVAELSTRADLTVLDGFEWNLGPDQEDQVMWFMLARIRSFGPTRPGEEYGFFAAVDATNGQDVTTACCYRLVPPDGPDPAASP